MKQPVAGVAPSTLEEVSVMTIWPSVAATGLGRFWGRLSAIEAGGRLFGVPVTVGRMFALLSIPFILPPYFLMLLPCFIWIPKIGPLPKIYVPNPWCRRYCLTNRRVVVKLALQQQEERSVSLDRFDHIEVAVLPGQAWYHTGDLVFKLGGVETFRLSGVPRPETFRHTCLKAQMSFVGVQKAREAGAAV